MLEHQSLFPFLKDCLDNPLKMETMIGAQASVEQMEKIKSYLDLGKKEGAKVLCGGDVAKLNSGLENGNYIQLNIVSIF